MNFEYIQIHIIGYSNNIKRFIVTIMVFRYFGQVPFILYLSELPLLAEEEWIASSPSCALSFSCLLASQWDPFIKDWSRARPSGLTEWTESAWSFNLSWLLKFSWHNGHCFPSVSPFSTLSVKLVSAMELLSSSAMI